MDYAGPNEQTVIDYAAYRRDTRYLAKCHRQQRVLSLLIAVLTLANVIGCAVIFYWVN